MDPKTFRKNQFIKTSLFVISTMEEEKNNAVGRDLVAEPVAFGNQFFQERLFDVRARAKKRIRI